MGAVTIFTRSSMRKQGPRGDKLRAHTFLVTTGLDPVAHEAPPRFRAFELPPIGRSC